MILIALCFASSFAFVTSVTAILEYDKTKSGFDLFIAGFFATAMFGGISAIVKHTILGMN